MRTTASSPNGSLDGTIAALESEEFRCMSEVRSAAGSIERVIFGPSGAYVLETCERPGRSKARDLAAAADSVRAKADCLRERLARGGNRMPVVGVVVLTAGKLKGAGLDDVIVATTRELPKVLRGKRVLQYHEIARCLTLVATDSARLRTSAIAWA